MLTVFSAWQGCAGNGIAEAVTLPYGAFAEQSALNSDVPLPRIVVPPAEVVVPASGETRISPSRNVFEVPSAICVMVTADFGKKIPSGSPKGVPGGVEERVSTTRHIVAVEARSLPPTVWFFTILSGPTGRWRSR